MSAGLAKGQLPVSIAADADDAAAVVEADFRVLKGAGEIGEFVELMIEQLKADINLRPGLGHFRIHAPQQGDRLFDHFVGMGE